MAPPPTDMKVPPSAARWMVHALGHRAPDPSTLQELLQCDSGLNNLILRDLKFIWSEMEQASFDFVKSKQVLSHISVPKPSEKKPKFISRLRRFFYIDDACLRPDPVALQEVTDAVAAASAAAAAAAALLNNATNKKTIASSNAISNTKLAPRAAASVATAARPSLHPSPPQRGGGLASFPAASSSSSSRQYQQHLIHQHHQYGAALASAAMAASSRPSNHGGGNISNNPWAAAGTSSSSAPSSGNTLPDGHIAASASAAGAGVPTFYPFLNHGHPHHYHQASAAAANSITRRRPHSQAFSSAAAASNDNYFSPPLPPQIQAMLRQLASNNNNNSAKPPEEQDEEDESRRPQNATEASIVAELQAFGFTDAREVLEGVRRLTAKNTNNAPPSVDDVMVDLVTQREELEHAKQMDEARLASEALRKEEARRRRESIAAELKERRLEAPLQEWLEDFFCNSWILSARSAYEVLDKCMMSNDSSSSSGEQATTSSSTTTTDFRDALFELLDTEKNSRQWYGTLPRAYYTVLVCKRLVDAGENSETLTKQLGAESETLKKVLLTLSEQTQGGVPRIFLEAHEEFGLAAGSDTENKNDDDDDEVEVLRRVESNSKGTSSSPQKKVRRSSSPKEQKDGDVIDLC